MCNTDTRINVGYVLGKHNVLIQILIALKKDIKQKEDNYNLILELFCYNYYSNSGYTLTLL